MANSALHAIAIDELRTSNPAFHQEYCSLVEGISSLISRLAKKHGEYITYTTFTESYDRASKEPILQMVLGSHKNEFYLHIYISKDGGFIIGKNGVGPSAQSAAKALALIEQEIHQAGWL
jgi:pyruvate dehydrogenase complex dehydrogenase (E1) component